MFTRIARRRKSKTIDCNGSEIIVKPGLSEGGNRESVVVEAWQKLHHNRSHSSIRHVSSTMNEVYELYVSRARICYKKFAFLYPARLSYECIHEEEPGLYFNSSIRMTRSRRSLDANTVEFPVGSIRGASSTISAPARHTFFFLSRRATARKSS